MGSIVLLAIGCCAAFGQDRFNTQPGPEPGAQDPQRLASRTSVGQELSPAATALQKAEAANKYLFLFFYREKNEKTDAMWEVFQGAMSKLGQWADWATIRVGDPAESQLVARFDATRAPMPLVLSLAPNGAVTKGFSGKFDENQLRQAFVSVGTAHCLKALQDRKLVLLCVQGPAPGAGQVALPQGVVDFTADPRYARFTQVVVLDPANRNEESFLKGLQVDPQTSRPVVVFLAPPGSLIGKFDASVTKDQLAAKLASAQSNPCAGGKCGPNGCGPKR